MNFPKERGPGRRPVLLALPALAMGAGALGAGAARAASAPDRPIRIVLGFPAGSGPDVVARLLAEAMREPWSSGIVVDNRPGAAGAIAAQEVARAAPDGHTLLLGDVSQLAMAPSTYARLPYDPARDFAPVAGVASADFAFVVPDALAPRDLPAYLEWARGRPSVFLGTFGPGTPGHFGASLLAAEGRFPGEAVHFRATGDAMSAVIGGDVQGLFGTLALVTPQVRAGRLRALATTGPARSGLLPEVPSMAELNLPRLVFQAWFGLVAPSATPEPVLARLEALVRGPLGGAPLRARMGETGFRAEEGDRAAFARQIRDETARWAAVVRETGFRALE